jgi:NNP family nitrate/nitrite transporter-like MFS transporter
VSAPIAYWNPDDRVFWAREGARVARRNLVGSVPALVVAFAVWMVWSVLVVNLPHVGYRFSTNQLFWLAAAPGLAGGTLRLLFAFVVPIFGGRRWTVFSTLLLLVPVVGTGLAVQDPQTGYPTFVMLALAAGIGGGNFASSIANIGFFFPADRKGTALGINAGLGNLGITLAQLVVPVAIGAAIFGAWGGAPQHLADGGSGQEVWLQNAGYVFVPAILLVALLAWFLMDDLASVEGAVAEQAVVFLKRDTWLLAWLYLGTFGSLLGFAAGFPLVTDTMFEGADVTAFAFAGPLAAALVRPLGGWLADRHDGARVALGCFVAMALAISAMLALPAGIGAHLTLFAVLFVASGLGNGAVFQMIPATFASGSRADGGSGAGARPFRSASLQAAAALGFASAIAAFGGFFIPKAYGTAVAMTGGTSAALLMFLVFYVTCIAITWRCYLHPRRAAPPSAVSPSPVGGNPIPREPA